MSSGSVAIGFYNLALFYLIVILGLLALHAVGWGLPWPKNFREFHGIFSEWLPPHIDRKVALRHRVATFVIGFIAFLILIKYGPRIH